MSEFHTSDEIFIGKVPVLDDQKKIAAYSLYFRRDAEGILEAVSDPEQNARALVGMVSSIGIQKLIGKKPGFIVLSASAVKNGVIADLPKGAFIYELPPSAWEDPECRKEISILRQQGHLFSAGGSGLDELRGETRNEIIRHASFLRVESRGHMVPEIIRQAEPWKGRGVKLVATGIETDETFQKLKSAGFDLFQGLFFAAPSLVRAKKLEPKHASISNLIRLIQQDLEIEDIEEEFKKVPELTVALLKFLNSASIFLRNRVTTIRQAITLIGYEKLLQWLLMLAYASSSEDRASNPLFRLAIQRAKAMEILSPIVDRSGGSLQADEAFFIGLLSLLDVLFSVPIEDVLSEMNVSAEVQGAILRHEGLGGRLLDLVQKTERNNFSGAQALLDDLHLPLSDVQTALISSFWWAEGLQEG